MIDSVFEMKAAAIANQLREYSGHLLDGSALWCEAPADLLLCAAQFIEKSAAEAVFETREDELRRCAYDLANGMWCKTKHQRAAFSAAPIDGTGWAEAAFEPSFNYASNGYVRVDGEWVHKSALAGVTRGPRIMGRRNAGNGLDSIIFEGDSSPWPAGRPCDLPPIQIGDGW